MAPDNKRVVIIGCTGAGKSTLLNKIAGRDLTPQLQLSLTHKKPIQAHSLIVGVSCTGNEYVLDEKFIGSWREPMLFESSDGVDSVTRLSSFANVSYLGDEKRQLTGTSRGG